ncbi:MAG: four helix bundle protein [Crocinitomicaceae bacterium]|jgi:four helix bundle protein|nr:four helix bundle protein [Crocinitomicaceae bacterium]
MALIKRYEDLNAWQRAYEVALEVDRLTNESSFDKKWALKDQMLRSSLSISSNIAEGFGRKSKKDFARFLLIAMGSTEELRSQIRFARDTGLIKDSDFNSVHDKLLEIGKMITGLRKYLLSSAQ